REEPKGRPRWRSRKPAWRRTATVAAAGCTSTSRCARPPRARRSTSSGSRPLDGSGRPRDRHADLTLADADLQSLDREPFGDRIRNRGGERLEEVELPPRGDLLDNVRHGDVVDRVLDPVGDRRLGDLEAQVVEEVVASGAFVLGHAVVSEDLERLDLDDDHPASAAATVSASTCSLTSCTRRMVAPRS